MKNFNLFTLKNGVRVLFVPRENSFSTYCAVMVGIGSKDETAEESGLSHFLEHLHLDGTKKYKNTLELQEAFDLLGADNNAFTNYYSTCYYTSVAAHQAIPALKLLTETFFESSLNSSDIAREKKVIAEETKRAWDDPDRFTMFKFNELLYGNLPAGRTVLGDPMVLSSFNRKTILDFKNKNYSPRKTLVIVAGNFPEKEVTNIITKKFETWREKGDIDRSEMLNPYSELSFTKPKIACYGKQIDQIKIMMGFPSLKFGHPDNHVLDIISIILTGGLNSRLYKTIRYKLGAAYGVSSWNNEQETHGNFVIMGGFDAGKIEVITKIIFRELRRLKEEEISAKELGLVKTKVLGWFMLGLETHQNLASFYSEQIIMGAKPLTPEEYYDKIKAVSAKDIKRVAKQIFIKEAIHLVAVGKDLKEEVFANLIKL